MPFFKLFNTSVLNKNQNKMNQIYKNCQGCGMPLKKDEKGGNSNGDGTKNEMFCSHGFENGHFTMPYITLEQMKERIKSKLKAFRHIKSFSRKLILSC
jgi:Putative zinc ribbon domain